MPGSKLACALVAGGATVLLIFPQAPPGWRPAPAPILTRWARQVNPQNVWPEYPRPQIVRQEWMNLNGLWEYAVTPKEATAPTSFQGQILVPFPIEAPLSGVGRQVRADEVIWYRRWFHIPKAWQGLHVLLNIEAADWETTVWVNGHKIGTRSGGYDPFSFDITGALGDRASHELLIRVWDPQDTIFKSLGKQANQPKDYERCSGIWQTVWLEPVHQTHLERLRVVAPASGHVTLLAHVAGATPATTVEYRVLDGGREIARTRGFPGKPVTLQLQNPKPWSPEDPHLYDLEVIISNAGEVVDRVQSYFGLRTVELGQGPAGRQILLNGTPVFQIGPLDQNYWPEGSLTAPSDAALRWDLEYLKRVGCNMVRLHVKENPRRWYYHCDRLGLLVWQDFISPLRQRRLDQVAREESERWLDEQRRLMETVGNHPSVIMWVVFNEAWGQHNSERIVRWVMEQDPTRLVDAASGWHDVPELGHIRDIHDYTFFPAVVLGLAEPNRAVVLGECGGFVSAVPPHNWLNRPNETGPPKNLWFGGFNPTVPRDDNREYDIFRPTFSAGPALEQHYAHFIDSLNLLRNHGLAAAVYTQLTDMKLEENGYLSFDRAVSKMDPARLAAIHRRLFGPPPEQRLLLPSSLEKPQTWRYTSQPQPNDDWTLPEFDDSSWQVGTGPFGNSDVLRCRTQLPPGTLYLRKKLVLSRPPARASIRVYTHLVGGGNNLMSYVRIYVNGRLVHDEVTRQVDPAVRVAEVLLWPESLRAFRAGENTLAVLVEPGFNARTGKLAGRPRSYGFDLALTEVTFPYTEAPR